MTFSFSTLDLTAIKPEPTPPEAMQVMDLNRFLCALYSKVDTETGRLALSAIRPKNTSPEGQENSIIGNTFSLIEAAVSWTIEGVQERNSYWSIGLADTTKLGPKLKKSEVQHTLAVMVDLDDPKAAANWQNVARENGIPKPSAIVKTGSIPHERLQLIWIFNEPESDLNKWVSISKGLCSLFSGDKAVAGDYSRLCRLPATLSHPNQDKRDKGYVTEWTELLDLNAARYELDDFSECNPINAISDMPPSCTSASHQALSFSAVRLEKIEDGIRLQLERSYGENNPQRHKHVYRCACLLFEAGYNPEQTAWVISQFPNGVGDKWLTDWDKSESILLQRISANYERWSQEHEALTLSPEAVDEIISHINSAPSNTAPSTGATSAEHLKTTPTTSSDTKKPALRLRTLEEVCSMELPVRNSLLGPWLLEQSLNLVHAPRGLGKTHFITAIGLAVAGGGRFLNWEAPSPKRVVLIDGEMPKAALQERYLLARPQYPELASENFHLIASEDHPNGLPDLSTVEGQEIMDSILKSGDLLIIDNLSTLCRTGVENDAESWSQMQQWLIKLRSRKITVILVAHDGKSGDQRGTSKKEDIMDNIIHLTRPKNKSAMDGAHMTVTFTKCRNSKSGELQEITCNLNEDGSWSTDDGYSETDKAIIAKIKEGIPYSEIAKDHNSSTSSISRLKKRAELDGLFEPKP
ncbi:hypothetical protein GCM10017044_04920 [Kordiimonas sediminis]|uniref:AAA+ ATPase domain-containing protein n=1 Tax=Kordiimonas sediminis TaxID=1735581 RepID=A0A919E5D7_9PROT|nr:AAA family ATPase [Kordiimonas sediminis]GHF13848.1 hypothetical protein GCM10017044_04920 [Kordiimonas sediminis]